MTPGSEKSAVRSPTPVKAFATVFLGVFLVIFVGGGLITFLLPDRFVSVARIFATTPAQLESFQSPVTLAAVSDELDLRRAFAQRFGDPKPFSPERTLDMLRRGFEVRRIRGTDLAEIRVSGHDPAETARLANAIAKAGVSNALKMTVAGTTPPEIVDRAMVPNKPAVTNKAFSLLLGALVGAVLGIMAGGVGARLAITSRSGNTGA